MRPLCTLRCTLLYGVALIAVAPLVGCKAAEPPSGFGVDLTIDARPLTARASVISLDVQCSGAEVFSNAVDVAALTATGGEGVIRARYIPAVGAGDLSFRVDALDATRSIVGTGLGGPVTLVADSAVSIDIALADAVAQPDLSLPDGFGPAHCTNSMLDSGETDVDCGGECKPCETDKICIVAADCATGNCDTGRCELASGPPSWLPVTALPAGRTLAAATALDDGNLYVIGGSDGTTQYTTTFYFDLSINSWTSSIAMASPPRASFAVVPVADKIIAVGGLTQLTTTTFDSLSSLASFVQGSSPAWTTLVTALSAKRAEHGAAIGSDGLVYVAGGRSYPATTPLATFESFNPATDGVAIFPRTDLPSARYRSAVTADAAGHIVVTGGNEGVSPASTPLARTDTYNPTTTTWSPSPALGTARDRLGAALGPDGRVYAVGGIASTPLGTAEVLPLGGARWVPLPSLSTPRADLAVTRGWDGRIYAIGGTNGVVAAMAQVEAYGPRIVVQAKVARGTSVAVAGTNFAANANVTLIFSGDAAGTIASTASTDASGLIAPSIVWSVPATAAAGTYTLTAVDDRSRFPVRSRVTVIP